MIEYIYIPDNFVTVTQGEPIRLFPIQSIFKNGVERTADMIKALKLPHFNPVIKLGSHADDAPAGGHIKELFQRDGWLWGVPEWVEKGTKAIQEGSYRYLSPEVLWEGEMEDSTTGEMLSGPLLVGAAMLHMPALGNAAAFYSVEPRMEVTMTVSDEKVSVSFVEKLLDKFGAKEPEPQTTPAPQVDDFAAKYEAEKAEREKLQTQIDAMAAKEKRGEKVAQFAAAFKEAPAVADDAELHELLADVPEEVAAKLVTKFKALSAQIDESAIVASPGKNNPGEGGDPELALYDAITKVATKDGIPFHEAADRLAISNPELFEGRKK